MQHFNLHGVLGLKPLCFLIPAKRGVTNNLLFLRDEAVLFFYLAVARVTTEIRCLAEEKRKTSTVIPRKPFHATNNKGLQVD